MTPFKALYGRDHPLFIKGTTIPSKVDNVNRLQQERDEILNKLKLNLCKAQEKWSTRWEIGYILSYSPIGINS